MNTYLKIKIKSLASEARMIRLEERKVKGYIRYRNRNVSSKEQPSKIDGRLRTLREGLHYHRIFDVRRESRSSCVAYGFLRGRDYGQIEQKCYSLPDWQKVQQIVLSFALDDQRVVKQRFANWIDGAEERLIQKEIAMQT